MKLLHYINGKLNNKYDDIDYKFSKLEKKYEFFLDNISNYIYITDRLIFIRENDEYIFTLEISENPSAKIIMKDKNDEYLIEISNTKYEVKENVIDFGYNVDGENEYHHIIMKVND